MRRKFIFIKCFLIILSIFLLISNLSITSNVYSVKLKKNEINNNFFENIIFGFKLKIINKRPILYKEPIFDPPEDGYPVIFLFHGATQHALTWFFGLNIWSRSQTSFTKTALENGFFVVSFESKRPIRSGPRAWDAFEEDFTKNYDILYVINVISWLENSSIKVDCDNIFCAGFSSGAFFCSRLAQSFGNRFKGVILNSGCNINCINLTERGPIFDCSDGYYISSFHPPTILIHGQKDSLVPFDCAESYYLDLKKNNINITTIFDENIGHIWLGKYNDEIINWIISKK